MKTIICIITQQGNRYLKRDEQGEPEWELGRYESGTCFAKKRGLWIEIPASNVAEVHFAHTKEEGYNDA